MFSEFELEWDRWVGKGPGGYSLRSPIYFSPSYRFFPPYSRLQMHYRATRGQKRRSRYPTRRMVEMDLSLIPSKLRHHFRIRRIQFGLAGEANTPLIDQLLELTVETVRDGLPPFDLASFKPLVKGYDFKKLENRIHKFLMGRHRRLSASEIDEFYLRGRRLVEPPVIGRIVDSLRELGDR